MKVKLGDIFEIGSGGTPSKSHPEYYGGDIPWVKTGDLKSEYLYKVEDFITEEGLKNSSAKLYEPDTVLIAMYGATIGATSILKIDACTNQACAAFKKNDKVIPEYLYYFLKSQKVKFVKDGVGGAQPNISAGYLKKVEMELPSLDEQRAIVEVLDKTTNIMVIRNQEIASLDNLIKARFVEMFGDPATNPMRWSETTIGDECFYIKDGPHKSLPDIGKENGGHPFISVRNIVNGYIDFSTARYISDEDYANAIKKCHPEKGDMLYSKGGTTGIAKLIDIDEEFANWVHVAVLKFDKSKLNGIFFENMLNGDYCFEQSQRLTKGIANRDLVLSAMAQIKMYRPPMEIQKQFADFVKQVDKSKVEVQKALDETQKLFDSLMQQYFG